MCDCHLQGVHDSIEKTKALSGLQGVQKCLRMTATLFVACCCRGFRASPLGAAALLSALLALLAPTPSPL